jgi:ResB-like family
VTSTMRGLLEGAAGFLGSLRLAFVLILLLMVLTLLGTIAQVDHSLYEVQQRFFASGFFVHEVGGVPLVLPGGYLLLGLLFVNLLVGGMLRMRRGKVTFGVLVIHVGIAVLLLAGFVEERWSQKGSVTLYEGQSASTFESDAAWEIAVTEYRAQGVAREFLVPSSEFANLGPGGRLTATAPDLPFDLVLDGFEPNAMPRPAGSGERDAAEGFVLEPVPVGGSTDVRAPGLYATLRAKGGGTSARGILWALESGPFQAAVADRTFSVDLRRESWELPFTLALKRFVHETHPGTSMARRFSSYLTRSDGGESRDVHVTMNEPLRESGYTVYQSGWGPENAPPGTPLFSTFAVVRNPSDRVPILACCIIAFGLVWHWTRKLIRYLQAAAPRLRSVRA